MTQCFLNRFLLIARNRKRAVANYGIFPNYLARNTKVGIVMSVTSIYIVYVVNKLV